MVSSIVLIHGALGAATEMEPVQRALESACPVHIVELVGHGNTPSRSLGFDIEVFAAQVREFITSHQLDRPAIFGYSMGGYVALHIACESPVLVSAVATLGTKLAWTPEVAEREVRRLDPEKLRAKVPTFAEALERRHRRAGGWEEVLEKTAALMRRLGERPVVNDVALAALRVPIRLMVGDADSLVTIEETNAARTLARGELAVLPRTPHPLDQVHLDFLATLLLDFFRDCHPERSEGSRPLR